MFEYRCGIDLVGRGRFREIFERRPALLEDVFTAREREECLGRGDPWKHLAGRFAAKEACLKALRLGFSTLGIDHALSEIEILDGANGQWRLVTHDWIDRLARRRKTFRWKICISYTRNWALAGALWIAPDAARRERPRPI
ncbi:MAG TPA: 4'-phosphopantetheinyl transferase superfamily protein [Candidatus Acidoferrales bacterium]|nr:4'-phosphopantetheinyl transferase superfamily protein [Candidatus Acidoferrales bacterium]